MAGDEMFYEVEKFLDRRVNEATGGVEYFVRWRGFSEEWDTWEPADNLTNCKTMMRVFEKERRQKRQATQKFTIKLVNKSKTKHASKKVTSLMNNGKSVTPTSVAEKMKSESMSLDDVFLSVLEQSNNKSKSLKKDKLANSSSQPRKRSLEVKSNTGSPKKQKVEKTNATDITLTSKVSLKTKIVKTPSTKWKIKPLSSSKPISASKKLGKTNAQSNVNGIQAKAFYKENIKKKVLNKSLTQLNNQSPNIGNKNAISSHTNTHSVIVSGEKSFHQKTPKGSKVKTVSSPKDASHDTKGGKAPNKQTGSQLKVKSESGKHSKKHKSTKHNVSISDLSPDYDSDEDVLYSLSTETSVKGKDSGLESKPSVAKRSKSETSAVLSKNAKSEKGGSNVKMKSKSVSEVLGGRTKVNKKKMRLMDSKKPTSPDKSESFQLRPVSPSLQYTTVKDGSGFPTSTGSLLATPTWVLPDEDSATPILDLQASLPISPASMSYKVLLENLPSQMHPKKTSKPGKSASQNAEDTERRVSVRATECAFKYKEILIKKCQKYSQIWLHSHTKMKNALNPTVMQEITSALNAAKYDDSSVVMLSGLNNVFCSGVDLHYLTTGDRKLAAKKTVEALRELVRRLITFPKLLVAVVTGPAVGLGAALLPLCDIVYASDKASFFMPYAQLAQTPEGCASFTLPDTVGTAMANELLIGCRKITAIEACQLGLVSQVYWPTSMMQEVIPRIQQMALLSSKTLETTKLLMRTRNQSKLELINEQECTLLQERWPSPECQRAMELFLANENNCGL